MNGRRWIVIAGAGLAALVGGGAALAASGSSDPASDFLGDVANRLGISKDKLEGAIDDAAIARIDRAVANGDLTKQQGEELKKRVRSGDGPVVLPGFRGPKLGVGPLGPPEEGFLHGPVPGFDLIDKAADYLGMDAADVREALGDGKSLADLAKDKGKSVDGLKETLRDAIREDAGRMADKLADSIDELVEHGGGPMLRFHGPRLGVGPLGPPGEGFFPGFDLIDRAADYLGTDAADVRKALSDGKSLADLAKDKGKSVEGLKETLRDAIRADVDKAVDKGALTKEQGDRVADKLSATVDELVEGGKLEFHLRVRPGGLPRPDQPAFAPA
jgi:lambda repressor-like predicted transcriptional regulator